MKYALIYLFPSSNSTQIFPTSLPTQLHVLSLFLKKKKRSNKTKTTTVYAACPLYHRESFKHNDIKVFDFPKGIYPLVLEFALFCSVSDIFCVSN